MAASSERQPQIVNRHHPRGDFDGVALVAQEDRVLLHVAFGLAERRLSVPHP